MLSLQDTSRFDISKNKLQDAVASVLSHNMLQGLNLKVTSGGNLQTEGVDCKCLQSIPILNAFQISNNHITRKAADEIAIVFSHNSQL